MNSKFYLLFFGLFIVFQNHLFGQYERQGVETYAGFAFASERIISRNYEINDTIDVSSTYKSPSWTLGVAFDQPLGKQFSLSIGTSYTYLNPELFITGFKDPDSLRLEIEGSPYFGVQSGSFSYGILGIDLALSKTLNLFNHLSIIGRLGLNYQFTKSSSNFLASSRSYLNSTKVYLEIDPSDNVEEKHFLSPKASIQIIPNDSKYLGNFFLFANVIWNNNLLHNSTNYRVFGKITENSGSYAQKLTHFTLGIGYRLHLDRVKPE